MMNSWYSGAASAGGEVGVGAGAAGGGGAGPMLLSPFRRLRIGRVRLERPLVVGERAGRILAFVGGVAECHVGLREGGLVALGFVDSREQLERSAHSRIRGHDRLEQLDRPRELAAPDGRIDRGRDHRERAVERLLLHPQLAEEDTRRLRVDIELKGLLGRADGLGALAHFELCFGKERETVRRPRRRLEDRHRGVGVVLREQRAHQALLRLHVVGRELEGLLENLCGLVVRAALQQHVSDQAVLHDGLVLLVGAAVEVREAHLDAHVGRVDRRHLLVDPDGVGEAVVLLVVIRQDLVLAPGVLDQALLVVQVRELVVDLQLGRVDLVDLLEDRDRLQEKAVLRVEVGDAGEVRNRVARPVHPDVQIPDFVQGRDVLGVLLEHPKVLLERLIELAAGEELLGGLEDLFAVDRH